MPFLFAGELAAIGTALCFTIGPIYFTLAGQKVGAAVVNRTRLLLAVIFLLIFHWIAYGTPVPLNAGADRWFWFTMSGVLGLTLGDAALFQAFIMIGTRLTILIFATNPIIAAWLAWLFLDEKLTGMQITGMLIALIGVTWVIAEKKNDKNKIEDRKNYFVGIMFAFLGAAGQAIGLITAKFGLVDDYPTLSGLVLRMITAVVAIWVWTFISGKTKETIEKLKKQPVAFKNIAIGAFTGPVIGVWLSLVAVKYAEIGVASTLTSLNPIFIIPLGYYFFNEKVSSRAIVGTVITLIGVIVLFL